MKMNSSIILHFIIIDDLLLSIKVNDSIKVIYDLDSYFSNIKIYKKIKKSALNFSVSTSLDKQKKTCIFSRTRY